MFPSALDAMHEAICLCDSAGTVLYINSAAKELTGWQEGSALHECCGQIPDNIGLSTCSIGYQLLKLLLANLPILACKDH